MGSRKRKNRQKKKMALKHIAQEQSIENIQENAVLSQEQPVSEDNEKQHGPEKKSRHQHEQHKDEKKAVTFKKQKLHKETEMLDKDAEMMAESVEHFEQPSEFEQSEEPQISEADDDFGQSTEQAKKPFFQWPEGFWDGVKIELLKILKKGAYYAVGILAVTAILVVFDLYSSDRVFPRTFLGPVALGYSSPDEAKKLLEDKIVTYLDEPITFIYKDWEIPLSLKELGVTFSADQALKHIPKIDFAETNVFVLATGLLNEEHLPLEFSLDTDKIAAILEQKFHLQDVKPQNARLTFDKKNILVEPERDGQVLNGGKLFADLKNNLYNLEHHMIVLEMQPQKADLTAAQLEEKKDHFKEALSRNIKLLYGGREWTLKPLDFADDISFEAKTYAKLPNADVKLPLALEENASSSEGLQVADDVMVAFHSPKLLEFIQKEISAKINKQTSGAKIYKDEKGKIIIEGTGQDGLTVIENRLIETLNYAVTKGISRIQIPVHEDKAPLKIAEDLQELGIKELLATGHSSFYGSSKNRRHNIDVGIAKYNGVVVGPGQEFSFNDILGPVDGSNGFVLEKVIKGDKAEMEFGGGICQVSSTLYRAALLAGLPIIERFPHSWKVEYYGQVLGHGLDATIYPGNKDVRFLNDTGSSILIQAYVEDSHAYFKLYGTGDGRKATLDGPYGGGLNYTWYRDLTKANGETVRETIVSRYKPIPKPAPPPATPPTNPAPEGTPPAQQAAGTVQPQG